MTLKTTLFLLRIGALAALGVLGVFILGVDPETLTLPGQTLFFLSLFAALGFLLALFLLSLGRRFLSEESALQYRSGALRQGMLLGALVAAIAWAQFTGYLTWWGALLFLVLILLIEFTYRQVTQTSH